MSSFPRSKHNLIYVICPSYDCLGRVDRAMAQEATHAAQRAQMSLWLGGLALSRYPDAVTHVFATKSNESITSLGRLQRATTSNRSDHPRRNGSGSLQGTGSSLASTSAETQVIIRRKPRETAAPTPDGKKTRPRSVGSERRRTTRPHRCNMSHWFGDKLHSQGSELYKEPTMIGDIQQSGAGVVLQSART